MGLFRKTNQRILAIPENFAGGFIQPLSAKRIQIELGEKLVVNKGWCAVIVLKDKPQDVFLEGEYVLNIPNLPNITRVLKLDKSRVVKRNGKKEMVFRTNFKCDLYFVNMQNFENAKWETGAVHKRDGKSRYNVRLCGSVDYRSVNAKETIRLFLLEWARIPSGKAQVRLLDYVGEFAESALDFSKEKAISVIGNKEEVAKLIGPKVEKNLSKYGVELTNFKVEKVDFGRAINAIVEQRAQDAELLKDLQQNSTKEDEEIIKKVPVLVETRQEQTATEESVPLLENIITEKEVKKKKKTKQSFETGIVQLNSENTTLNDISKNFEENNENIFNSEPDGKVENVALVKKESESDIKICPKCQKVHKKEDQMCDCGCILE